jgi:hypothetical protein
VISNPERHTGPRPDWRQPFRWLRNEMKRLQ